MPELADLHVFILLSVTFGAVLFFLVRSKRRTEDRLTHDTPKSALAKDGPTGDVEDRSRI